MSPEKKRLLEGSTLYCPSIRKRKGLRCFWTNYSQDKTNFSPPGILLKSRYYKFSDITPYGNRIDRRVGGQFGMLFQDLSCKSTRYFHAMFRSGRLRLLNED